MVAMLSAFTVLAMTTAASAVPLLKCILMEIVFTPLQIDSRVKDKIGMSACEIVNGRRGHPNFIHFVVLSMYSDRRDWRFHEVPIGL